MIEILVEVVYRRLRTRGRLGTCEAQLVWRSVLADGVPVRRTLIRADTGEILDDVWLDPDRRVRSWSVHELLGGSDPPDGRDTARIEAVVAAAAGTDDGVIEHGRHDRTLAS